MNKTLDDFYVVKLINKNDHCDKSIHAEIIVRSNAMFVFKSENTIPPNELARIRNAWQKKTGYY